MTWDQHVDYVVTKGNRTLEFVRRNLKAFPDSEVKKLIEPSTFHPYGTLPYKQGQGTLKHPQRRAARFENSDYTTKTLAWMSHENYQRTELTFTRR